MPLIRRLEEFTQLTDADRHELAQLELADIEKRISTARRSEQAS